MRILNRDALRRSSAVMALLMVLTAIPGVFPMFAGALAMVDAGHRVQFGVGTEDVMLVLHHESGWAVQLPYHQHGPLGRALVFFSKSNGGNPDHVLHFVVGGKFLRNHPLVVPTPEPPVVAPALIPIQLVTSTTPPPGVHYPDRPAPPGALLSTSTTLLLI